MHFKPRLLPVMAAPFLALMFSFSTSEPENKKLGKDDYSGRQLFSALFLHDKVLIKELKTYAKVTNFMPASGQQTEAYRCIITEIEKQNPAFFDDFKAAIVSGNHLSVKKGIGAGQQMLVKTVKELDGDMPRTKEGNPTNAFPGPAAHTIIFIPDYTALDKLKNDNLFCETLVNELVHKFN